MQAKDDEMADYRFAWPEWFDKPQGRDYPSALHHSLGKWRTCGITFGAEYLFGMAKVSLDSQQPHIGITLGGEGNSQIIFTPETCDIDMGIEGDNESYDDFIRQTRAQFPKIFEHGDMVYFIKFRPFDEPVVAGAFWTLDESQLSGWERLRSTISEAVEVTIWFKYVSGYKRVRPALDRFRELCKLVNENASDGRPRAFWYYYATESTSQDRRRKGLPWLWGESDDRKGLQYTPWEPKGPFFLNDHDRRWRLLEATKIEKDVQERIVVDVFNKSRQHSAQIFQSDNKKDWYLHIYVLQQTGEKAPSVPEMGELSRVEFRILDGEEAISDDISLTSNGRIVHMDTLADFVVSTRGYFHPDQNGSTVRVVLSIKPNLMPIQAQIDALDDASRVTVYGDHEAHAKQGFSLRRTILAHGTELHESSEHFFNLDVRDVSTLDKSLQEERIAYIMGKFPLDKAQRTAWRNSICSVKAGIHLVQGPPGTGKTRTGLVVILTLAALNIRVLLCAGSNKGVDNLTYAVFNALKSDEKLRSWCGQVTRFRTPSYQLSVVRKDSASRMLIRRMKGDLAGIDLELEQCQVHTLAQNYALDNAQSDSDCEKFLRLAQADRQRGLSGDDTKALRSAYEGIVMTILGRSKIVATTLSNASQDVLRLSAFKPGVLVSDESGQSTEGDHMIAMTMDTLRAVVLLGDPQQLPPTVISEHGSNEGASYLKRSLMSRLYEAKYPCTRLNVNYRSHPEIFDLYNKVVYGGSLEACSRNSEPERVGTAWDSFTESRHWFRNTGVAGVRRLFISTIGGAEQSEGSRSWSNRAQVEVIKRLLPELYQFQDEHDNRIGPEDVMIISPYKDQQRLIRQQLGEVRVGYRDNLTIDASQGQEAPVVIYSLTKPSESSRLNTGFIADSQRMNVALSRAQKVMIIIGNLAIWDEETINKMDRHKPNKFLVKLLRDVTQKCHTISWVDTRTVTEREPEEPVTYFVEGRTIQQPVPAVPLQSAGFVEELHDDMDIDEEFDPREEDRHPQTPPPRPHVNLPRPSRRDSVSLSRQQPYLRSRSRDRRERNRSRERYHRRRSRRRSRSPERQCYRDRSRSSGNDTMVEEERSLELQRMELEVVRQRRLLQETDMEIRQRELDIRREEYNRSRRHRAGRDSRHRHGRR